MEIELIETNEENVEIEVDDDNIYSERVRNQLLEDDELTSAEEGFMVGYLGA